VGCVQCHAASPDKPCPGRRRKFTNCYNKEPRFDSVISRTIMHYKAIDMAPGLSCGLTFRPPALT